MLERASASCLPRSPWGLAGSGNPALREEPGQPSPDQTPLAGQRPLSVAGEENVMSWDPQESLGQSTAK